MKASNLYLIIDVVIGDVESIGGKVAVGFSR